MAYDMYKKYKEHNLEVYQYLTFSTSLFYKFAFRLTYVPPMAFLVI